MTRKSLRHGLFRQYAIALLIATLLLALTAGFLLQRTQKEQLRQRNEAILLAQYAAVEQMLNEPSAQLRTLSKLLQHDSLHRQLLLDGFTQPGSRIRNIQLLDSTGRLLAISPQAPQMLGFDMSRLEHIQQARHSNEPVWSKVFLGQEEEKPTIALCLRSGSLLLSAQLSLDISTGLKLPTGTRASLAVTDPSGAYIYHVDQSKVLERETFPWFRQMREARGNRPIVTRRFSDSQGNWLCTGWFFGDQGWGIFLIESEDILLAPLQQLLLAMGAITLLFVFIMLPLLYLGISSIDRPLRRLNAYIGRIAMGSYEPPRTDYAYEEFHSLSLHVAAMAQSIGSREEELRQANLRLERLSHALQEKNLDLEAMIHATSHDLRTPLVNITGFSDEMQILCQELIAASTQEEGAQPGRLQELAREEIPAGLGVIRENAARMGRMLQGILAFSRIHRQQNPSQVVDMGRLSRQNVDSIAPRLALCLGEVEIGETPAVYAHEEDLSRIFAYILDNAIKYRHPRRPLRIFIFGERQGERTLYHIRDNGIGIAKRQLPMVFHPFYRCETHLGIPGEGMGLTMAKRYAERNEGSLHLESTAGEGTTVTLDLPSPVKA